MPAEAPIRRLLIANRGEIAVRIARAATELGITPVGVFAPEDAPWAARYPMATYALQTSGVAAYLDSEGLIRIAREHDCDALHPGYGMLSEHAEFAEACRSANIRFVGPSPQTLRHLGDKPSARQLAARLGVPIIEGTNDDVTLAELQERFEDLSRGEGIMLKASAGGGGRGMRPVTSLEDLPAAFERCRSEAQRAFGSGALYAERLIRGGRHIEVQIVADRFGNVVSLGERECSLQRRRQKIIEIAPSPSLSETLRARVVDAARTMAEDVGYENIGTFEFLVQDDAFFFMEANPRLQVEHPVTEAVTGVDLVQTQLQLAAGARLSDLNLSSPPPVVGWALEARVYAERMNETGQAEPTTGEISQLTWPTGPGIRTDTAAFVGAPVAVGFDGLLAKLIASSRTSFEAAVQRLRRALAEVRIDGVETNVSFLSALAARFEVATNDVSIDFVTQHADAIRKASLPSKVDPSPSSSPSEAVVRAPFAGVVLERYVSEGDVIVRGQVLCILESMKMEHEIRAMQSGRIERVTIEPGATVTPEAPLFWLTGGNAEEASQASEASVDLAHIRDDLAELHRRLAMLQDDARPEAVKKRRARGQRTARENIAALCDPDSFSEYGGLAIAAQRATRPLETLQRQTPTDGVITGLATINRDDFGPDGGRSVVLAVDATVIAGTQGYFHHHKLDRMFELAHDQRMPVVMFAEGGGGRPNDTDLSAVMTSGLTVPSFRTFGQLSGVVPKIAIVSGYCFAGNAALAGNADILIATQNAHLGMGGPAMIEGGGLGRFAPSDIGPVSVQESNGVVDLVVKDEEQAAQAARRLLSYFQGNVERKPAADQRILRHLVPENRRRVYDVRKIIEVIADKGSTFELQPNYGQGILTYFARFEGRPVGLIANNPQYLSGAIDPEAADKVAGFLPRCNAFNLPVVSLCDTPGFMVGPDTEAQAQVKKASYLFTVGAQLKVPLFMVILRKAYGLGAQAMGAGSLAAPAFTVAWPSGELGGMGLEGAVQLGFRKQLDAIADPAQRQAMYEQLVAELYERGKALNAASLLELDAVIDPADTRDWIVRGLQRFLRSRR